MACDGMVPRSYVKDGSRVIPDRRKWGDAARGRSRLSQSDSLRFTTRR